MIQTFNHRKAESSFTGERPPRLVHSCRLDTHHVDMPRAMHMHRDTAELVLITEGEGTHIIGTRTYSTRQGDVLIYNAEVLHDEIAKTKDGMNTYCLGITDLAYPGLGPNRLIPDRAAAVYASGDRYPSLQSLFSLIHRANISADPMAGEYISYLLRGLLVAVRELTDRIHAPAHPSEEDRINDQIKAYLDAHYAEDLSLESIANALHLSPYYISHLFKQYEGISPIKYVLRRRIGEAQSLLIASDRSVTEIAMGVGYRNVSHFHAAFVKTVGLTPRNYRNYWIAQTKHAQDATN